MSYTLGVHRPVTEQENEAYLGLHRQGKLDPQQTVDFIKKMNSILGNSNPDRLSYDKRTKKVEADWPKAYQDL